MKKLLATLMACAMILTLAVTPALADGEPAEPDLFGREIDRIAVPERRLSGFGSLFGLDETPGEGEDLFGTTPAPEPTEAPAAEGDLIALDDLSISISVEDYVAIRQEDDFVYVYTMTDGSIPYIIIGFYEFQDDDIAEIFTDFMRGGYSDLTVSEEASEVEIGDNTYTRIVYEYTVSGFTVVDTRLFLAWNGLTYMFGTKEVPELDYFVEDDALEQVAGSIELLAGGEDDYERHVDSDRSVFKSKVSDLGGLGGDSLSTGGGKEPDPEPTPEPEPEPTPVDDPKGGDEILGSIEFDESRAPYDGVWVQFEDGFQLYLPSHWTQFELTDEEFQSGLLYFAGDNTGVENAPYLSIYWGYASDFSTLGDVVEILSGVEEYEVDGILRINGIDCVSYACEEYDSNSIIFFHPQLPDYYLEVIVSEVSANVDTQNSILCSLTPFEP